MTLTVHSQVTFAPQHAEDADDVPPGRDEHRRRRFRVAPGVPVSVHLVAEAHDDRVVVGADGLRVGAQVAVVAPGGDSRDTDTSGSICTSGAAPSLATVLAKPAGKGSYQPL